MNRQQLFDYCNKSLAPQGFCLNYEELDYHIEHLLAHGEPFFWKDCERIRLMEVSLASQRERRRIERETKEAWERERGKVRVEVRRVAEERAQGEAEEAKRQAREEREREEGERRKQKAESRKRHPETHADWQKKNPERTRFYSAKRRCKLRLQNGNITLKQYNEEILKLKLRYGIS